VTELKIFFWGTTYFSLFAWMGRCLSGWDKAWLVKLEWRLVGGILCRTCPCLGGCDKVWHKRRRLLQGGIESIVMVASSACLVSALAALFINGTT
jgi:hypothetical protein